MNRLKAVLLLGTALGPLAALPALANPLGGDVVAGDASVAGEGTPTVTVTQGSDKAIIDWRSFNVGLGETTQFVQPSQQSVTLNRVTGGEGASTIAGAINANGQVFLVNPDGILFTKDAQIDVGGLLATTNDISNSDFMAGTYRFSTPGNPTASVVNEGTITVTDTGMAALVAPGVRNAGTITANLGKVSLASGNSFTLDFYGDNLIDLAVDDSIAGQVIDVATGKPLTDLVSNSGLIRADGGTVQLTAAAARSVVDSVINNTGNIEANSVGLKNGKIVLSAATSKSKPAGAPKQTVKVSGTLSASGRNPSQAGGVVQITGEVIDLAVATIDAYGWNGGGKVLIGGDYMGGHGDQGVIVANDIPLESLPIPTSSYVFADPGTTINADALHDGKGGKVILWSDEATATAAAISARGGAESGDGGFIETSGKYLDVGTAADASAPNGVAGTWLLDPLDVTIKNASTNNFTYGVGTVLSNSWVGGNYYSNLVGYVGGPSGSGSIIDTALVDGALDAGTSVKVSTWGTVGSGFGNISVKSDILKSSGSSAFLILDSAADIYVAPGVNVTATSGNLNLFLWAHDGSIDGASVGTIDTNGGVFKLDALGNIDFVSSGPMPYITGVEIDGATAPSPSPVLIHLAFRNDLVNFTYQNEVATVAPYGVQLVDNSNSQFELIAHNMNWALADRSVTIAAGKHLSLVFDPTFTYGATLSSYGNSVPEMVIGDRLAFPLQGDPDAPTIPVLAVSYSGPGTIDEYVPTSAAGQRLISERAAPVPNINVQAIIDSIIGGPGPQCSVGPQCIDPNPLASDQSKSDNSSAAINYSLGPALTKPVAETQGPGDNDHKGFMHDAYDFASDFETPILSLADGIVVDYRDNIPDFDGSTTNYSSSHGPSDGLGNYITVAYQIPGDPSHYYYASYLHLKQGSVSALNLTRDEKIIKGSALGQTGRTGATIPARTLTDPADHLHVQFGLTLGDQVYADKRHHPSMQIAENTGDVDHVTYDNSNNAFIYKP